MSGCKEERMALRRDGGIASGSGQPAKDGRAKTRKRILIVDDEPDIRLTLRMLLEHRGYQVEEAEDGAAARARLGAGTFDLMILDLLMPSLSGEDVIRRLSKERRERMPVIMLTAKGRDEDMREGYALGSSYYITKPFKNQRIVDAAEYLIGDGTPAERAVLELRL